MLTIDKKTRILYITLFAAIYNDFIRIPGTPISLFRILQPAVLLVVLLNSSKCRRFGLAYLAVITVNFVQYYAFSLMNSIDISFDIREFAIFSYYYLCILTVICTVVVLHDDKGKDFDSSFRNFIYFSGWINIIITLLYGTLRSTGLFEMANINNYGASIAAAFPFFAIKATNSHRIKDYAPCLMSVIALYLGDCKLSILGVFAEIIILGVLLSGEKKDRIFFMKPKFIGLFIIVLLASAYVLLSSPIGEEILRMLPIIGGQIKRFEFLPVSTSMGYRINVIILGTMWLFRTRFLGVGMGNFGKIIRSQLPYLQPEWFESSFVSPHNAPLEFLIEFGPIAIIAYYLLIKRIIEALRAPRTEKNVLIITVFISMFVWILNPSRIITHYHVWIVFTYLLLRPYEVKDEDFDCCSELLAG